MAHELRYCHQILYGCSDPSCETPTCLSCRRRVSERPFRPYTVISARALATFLASQDQPGKGLCPYTCFNIKDSTLQQKEPSGKHIISESTRKRPQSPRSPGNGAISRDETVKISHEDIHAGNFNHRPQEDAQVSVGEGTTRPTPEEACKKDQSPKGIDAKSFTQSLFNTASMKSLHSSNVFEDVFRSYGSPGLEPSSATPLVSRTARSIDAAAAGCSEDVSDQNMSPRYMPDSPPTQRERCISADKIAAIDLCRKGQERGLEDPTAGICDTAQPSPRSLSHFSSANIRTLLQALVQRHGGLFQEHCFLRGQGRADFPSPPEKICAKQHRSYLEHLAFIAQSISYVLSSPEALMKSFLKCTLEGNSYTVAQSDTLPSMITSFKSLSVLDFHPTNVLQSLWVSTAHICHFGLSHKNESARVVELHPPDSTRESLNNLEACHVLKVTFAALIASIPRCNAETMIAVAKLRTSGAIASFEGLNDSLHSPKLSEEILDCALAFNEEMPLNVVKSAVTAIAARHYGRKSSKDYPKVNVDTGNFYDHVMYYLFADHIKVYLGDQPASSLRGASLTVPQDIALARNLEQPPLVMIHWLQTLILKEWDGKPRVPKSGAVGGAIELLRQMFLRSWLDIDATIYPVPLLAQRLDMMTIPTEWATCDDQDENSLHLLSFPFLFSTSTRVAYFRAINYDSMYKAFEGAAVAGRLKAQMTFTGAFTERGAIHGTIQLTERLRRSQNKYLVLEIRREDVLTDAMDQLWRRRRPEIMRPLKIRMGMAEGEEGDDHGGVQQEFFRIAVAEALDPKYGIFMTDSESYMSWFRPGSLEPLYKFELLGLLTSLAVHNGLTLPFSLPLAFYRYLLGLPVMKISDIQDGWPALSKGLQKLLEWPDDNVEEIWMRPYVFSVDVFGTNIDVDMSTTRNDSSKQGKNHRIAQNKKKKSGKEPSLPATNPGKESSPSLTSAHGKEGEPVTWSSENEGYVSAHHRDSQTDSSRFSSDNDEIPEHTDPFNLPQQKARPQPEPIMVTNENREQYILDYITYLTDYSIRQEKKAFEDGFFTCINRKSISLFSPAQLKHLVEGLPDIDLDLLQNVTKYEGGFHPSHPTIRLFWLVVRSWSQDKLRQLLEFVTASDRLPAGDLRRINFQIQKHDLGDSGRLPTSSTCFGRLLLPPYLSEDVLRRKLELAVANSKGFGLL